MVNKRPVQLSVFRKMFRHPAKDDPTTWDHLIEMLVAELKYERTAYYGTDGSDLELAYPGFDYTNTLVRFRLCRYSYHYKLYQAFDALQLSSSEIEAIAIWWGTAEHRLKYEIATGQTIRDTVEDDIPTEDELDKVEMAKQLEHKRDQELVAYTLQQAELERIIKSTESSTYYNLFEGMHEVHSAHSHFPYLMEQYVNYAL